MDKLPIATPTTNIFLQAMKKYTENTDKKPKNYPLVLVIGSSGTGKSRAIKGLPPEETAILNLENKSLPFQGSENYPYNLTEFKLPSDVELAFAAAVKEAGIKYIVIDSLTKYLEMLFKFCEEQTRGSKNSYEKFQMYNTLLGNFLDTIKCCGPKMVVLTGHPEIISELQPNGMTVRLQRLSVTGKQWEGKVEKEFTLVLYTDVRKEGDKIRYSFVTATDGTNSAKTPEGMFKELRIDNDLSLVCRTVKEFYKLD